MYSVDLGYSVYGVTVWTAVCHIFFRQPKKWEITKNSTPSFFQAFYNTRLLSRVSIRKTFAQNAKFFFRCASVLREKTAICAIIRKSHFAQNCPIPLFRNSSFAQFRNFVIIICVYFLELKGFSPAVSEFWKNLVLEIADNTLEDAIK